MTKSILDNSASKATKATFFAHLSENGMVVYEIKAYPIADTIKEVKKGTLMAWGVSTIDVNSTDFSTNEGYVRINNELDIPLTLLKLQEGPYYFYDKDLAIKKVTNLNADALKVVEEKLAEYQAAFTYMKTVVAKDLF